MKNFRSEKLNSLSLAALLMAGATFTACSSDDAATEQNPAQKTYTLTVNATKGGDATTRALSLEDKTLIATWATTENIYVKKGGTSVGTLNPDASGALATLKGELTGDFAVGQTLDLTFPRADIDYTGQVGTLADIAAKYDYAMATATITSVNGSTIGADNGDGGNVIFQNQQAIIKFTLLDKANNAAISPSALTVTDGTSTVSLTSIPASTYTANGDGVLYVAFPATGGSETITLTATVGGDTYTYEKPGATFTNEEYYDIAVKMTKQAPLAGVTAGDIGKVVCAAGHLHDAKTDVPSGCTAVGILGKVTTTGHGLILALKDAATKQKWRTINNDWTSVTYAGTTLKLLPESERSLLTSYTMLGSTAVSDWCVGQKSDYEAIFINLGSTTTGEEDGYYTYDANVNAYITGVGGTAISGTYWSATECEDNNNYGWNFGSLGWSYGTKGTDRILRPVLGF